MQEAFALPSWVRENVHQTFQGHISRNGRPLGRLYTHVLSGSYHAACLKHQACQRWVPIVQVPEPIRLQDWIVMQSEYESAAVHMGMLDAIVHGERRMR